MFIIFAVKLIYKRASSRPRTEDRQGWVDMAHLESVSNNAARIYNVAQFGHFDVTIDFGSEKSKTDGLEMMERFTRQVRAECPVARALGITGNMINGEGIVWKPVDVEAPLKLEQFTGHKFWVKTGAKSVPTNGDEMMRYSKKGW